MRGIPRAKVAGTANRSFVESKRFILEIDQKSKVKTTLLLGATSIVLGRHLLGKGGRGVGGAHAAIRRVPLFFAFGPAFTFLAAR